MKNMSRITAETLPRYSRILPQVDQEIAPVFVAERATLLFSPETTQDLDTAIAENPQAWNEAFQTIYGELEGTPLMRSPGHDLSHVNDNLVHALRVIQDQPTLTEAQRLEIVTAILFHDTGRAVEASLVGKVKDPDKVAERTVPALLGKVYESRYPFVPPLFRERVLYDIGTGSEAKTGYITADLVHECDRAQLLGVPTIPRGLAYDVVEGGRSLRYLEGSKWAKETPRPGSDEDTSWLAQYEFYLRKVFPPFSPQGELYFRRLKQQTATFINLGIHNVGDPLYDQVFGGDLDEKERQGFHWSKAPIDRNIVTSANGEADRIRRITGGISSSPHFLLEFARKTLQVEGCVIPDRFDEVMSERIGELSGQERENFRDIVYYANETLQRIHVGNSAMLNQVVKHGEGIAQTVAGLVHPHIHARALKRQWLMKELQAVS